jgi:hypothetical protein
VPPAPAEVLLLSLNEVLELPRPKWVLDHVFTRGSLVAVYGAPGSAKSFLALDWALSIAAGGAWLDYDVIDPGPVVYVAAEGTGGLPKRLRAWLQEHQQVAPPPVLFWKTPLQLLNEEDVTRFLMQVIPIKPVLVILDTFAMCFDGDENHSKDMSLAIAAAKEIIRKTAATVILVHHTGKKGSAERGHSALRAAADTMMLVEAKSDASGGKLIVVSNTKQKDEEEFLPITVQLKQVKLDATEEGEELTSCVLQSNDGAQSSPRELSPAEAGAALTILVREFPDGAGSTQWYETIKKQNKSALPKRTYHNYRSALVVGGFVELVPGRKSCYRATDAGRAFVRPSTTPAPSADDKEGTVV